MSEQSKHKIVPQHKFEYYQARAMLLGVEYNNLYHMFVQRGSGSKGNPLVDFKAWDADTMELLAHQDYHTGETRQVIKDNYMHRYNEAGYFKEGYSL